MAQRIREDSASQEYERNVSDLQRSTGARRADQLAAWCGDATFVMLPASYVAAKDRANFSKREHAILRAYERVTLAAYTFTPTVRMTTKRIAGSARMPQRTAEDVIAGLTKRGILFVEEADDPNSPEGPVRGINPDFSKWDYQEATNVVDMDTENSVPTENYGQGVRKITGKGYGDFRPHVLDLNLDQEEINTCDNNDAREEFPIDISHDRKQERLEDQAILDHLAATIPPEPIRYRPLTKTDQTRRNTTSPGDAPEPAFVAWREGFKARYKHEPGRMNDDLRRLLLDLSCEYPTVIDKVVRGYFVWTKLDEGKIRAKGLEETLEAECAACAGNPNRTPFPPDVPIPKQSFSAPPPQRLTRLDPMDAYKKKRVPPTRALEVSP